MDAGGQAESLQLSTPKKPYIASRDMEGGQRGGTQMCLTTEAGRGELDKEEKCYFSGAGEHSVLLPPGGIFLPRAPFSPMAELSGIEHCDLTPGTLQWRFLLLSFLTL